jgi:hypothetical protein
VLDDERVVLGFPHFGSQSEGARNVGLSGKATLQRSAPTSMHGGIAGGIRRLAPERVVWWLPLLASGTCDVQLHGHGHIPRIRNSLQGWAPSRD